MYLRVAASHALLFTRPRLASSPRYAIIPPTIPRNHRIYFHASSRPFSLSRPALLNSLDTFSDDEEMFRESGIPTPLNHWELIILIVMAVRRFANDVVAPKVREMDENEMMDPEIIKGLFEQGVRSIFPERYHGLSRRKYS